MNAFRAGKFNDCEDLNININGIRITQVLDNVNKNELIAHKIRLIIITIFCPILSDNNPPGIARKAVPNPDIE